MRKRRCRTNNLPPMRGQIGADVPDNPYAIGSQSRVVGRRVGDPDAPEVPGFTRALRICLVEKHCCFRGRASRSEYWLFFLWWFLFRIGVIVTSFLLILLDSPFYLVPVVVFFLCFFLSMLSATVRRFHDVGLSGWIVVLYELIVFALSAARLAIEETAASGLKNEGFFIPTNLSGGSLVLYVILQCVVWALRIGFIVVLCLPGTKGPNKYGPAPWKR